MFKTLSLIVALGAAAFAYDSRSETFTGRASLDHQYEIVGVYGAPWQFPQAEPVNCFLDFTLWRKQGPDFRYPSRNPQFEAQDSQRGCSEKLDKLAYRLSQTKHSDSDRSVEVEAQCHPLSNWSATPDCDVTLVKIAGRTVYTR